LDTFVGEESDQERATSDAVEETGSRLFGFSADEFVNAGAADLAARLQVDIQIDVYPDRIVYEGDNLDDVLRQLRDFVEAEQTTHRRKSIAHSVNHALKQQGGESDARGIPPTTDPFPSDVTVYENDEVEVDRLGEQGVPITDELAEQTRATSVYTPSETYVGLTQEGDYDSQVDRFDRYHRALTAVLTGEVEEVDEHSCVICGRTDLPSYDDPFSEENEKVDYNQTFAPLVSTSGQARPLGGGSRRSTHKGRCVACLVAGFHFAHMPKIVRQTGSNDNDARVFVPVGGFEELVGVSGDLQRILENLDVKVGDQSTRSRTLGQIQTLSLPLQALDLYERILRHVNRVSTGDAFQPEIQRRPTELISFVSGVDQTREIGDVRRIRPSSPAYDIVAPDRYRPSRDDRAREYWPISDVVRWFAEAGDRGTLLPEKDALGEGLLDGDLERLERGIVGIGRDVLQDQASLPGYARPHPRQLHQAFDTLMTRTTAEIEDIGDESIESIRNVASSIGSVFSSGDDIGVLIGLQNAGTQSEFLRAFEKASMQAQKQSLETAPQQFNTARDDDVERVLRLINDDETFKPTKRMFVIHAALAAQYENATGGNRGDEE
jgi:hypothetical protein